MTDPTKKGWYAEIRTEFGNDLFTITADTRALISDPWALELLPETLSFDVETGPGIGARVGWQNVFGNTSHGGTSFTISGGAYWSRIYAACIQSL